MPEKGLSTTEVSEEVCDPSSNSILLPPPLKGMCQHFNKSDACFKGKKKVGNPHMHTLLRMLEHFRSAAEEGFLFRMGSFYPFYVNREIAQNIFKWDLNL